jgi:hypothetical protein
MLKKAIMAAILLCIGGGLLCAGQPVIVEATINSGSHQITITGTNLTPMSGLPVVTLGSSTLTVVTASATTVVATVPTTLAVGTYELQVTAGTLTGTFDVSYGTLTLPFVGQARSSGNAFEVDQFNSGSTGIYGSGGPTVGSMSGGTGLAGQGGASFSAGFFGGDGVYGQGGNPLVAHSYGGNGGEFYGGGNASLVGGGGVGVWVQGGDSAPLSGGGDGGDFFGGGNDSGAFAGGRGLFAQGGDSGVGSGATAGNGIEAYPGQGPLSVAGYFGGNVTVQGNLSKAGGSFVIDHPTDPEHKFLYHSFVESPDMMNIYNGTVFTDGSGMAVVRMPEWFEALNRDFRYQLTVIGQFAQAIVASEIANSSFVIRTDKPGIKVSWQVTGIRQDAWANAHRIPLEVEKAPEEQGHYLHPELHGHAGEPDIQELHHPRPLKKQPAPISPRP